MVQWLRLHASNAEGTGSVSCEGIKILQAVRQKRRRRKWLSQQGLALTYLIGLRLRGVTLKYTSNLGNYPAYSYDNKSP